MGIFLIIVRGKENHCSLFYSIFVSVWTNGELTELTGVVHLELRDLLVVHERDFLDHVFNLENCPNVLSDVVLVCFRI